MRRGLSTFRVVSNNALKAEGPAGEPHARSSKFYVLISRILCFLAILSFCLNPGFAWAEIGDVLSLFHPYVGVSEEYNDNLFLTSRDRTDDFITTVWGGISFSTLPPEISPRLFRRREIVMDTNYGLDLNYHMGYVFYTKNDRLNYTSLGGDLDGWYRFSRDLILRVDNYSVRSDEPRERDYSPTALPTQFLLSTERDRRIYFRNVFTPTLQYQFGRENIFSIEYGNNIYRTQSPFSENSLENSFSPRVAYWFDVRNGIDLSYGLRLGNFERSPDFTAHMASGRYTHRFNPQTSIFLDTAFETYLFHPISVDNYYVITPTVGINYAFTRTLEGLAQLGYFLQDRKSGQTTKGPSYQLSLTKMTEWTSYAIRLQGGYTEDYITSQNLGFTKYHRVMGSIQHHITEGLLGGISGTLERASYPSLSPRRDTLWEILGGLSYPVLRWLNLSLSASHRENNSNIDSSDYRENRAMFQVSATL